MLASFNFILHFTNLHKASDDIRTAAEEPEAELPFEQEHIQLPEVDICDTVAAHLMVPNRPVQLLEDHANHRVEREQSAFAKIAGKGWTLLVKHLKTSIGRAPEPTYPAADSASTHAHGNDDSELSAEEANRIHMDLGPNKIVSRLHADVLFSTQGEHTGWHLVVHGRNGAKVDGLVVPKGKSCQLRSGNVIDIAGVEMLFVLPESEEYRLQIHKTYLKRAGLIQGDFPEITDPIHFQANHSNSSSAARSRSYQTGPPSHPALAPAPPDYRRPDTPQKQRSRAAPSSTPRNGLTFMNSENTPDYSLNENRDIKPAFTYSQLISQAILSTGNEKATLATIYDFVKEKYAWYRREGTEKGWQNSIRHNLSLNAGFEIAPRETHEPGKGGYWVFVPSKRDDLVEEAYGKVRKSPTKKSSSPNSPQSKNRRATHGPGDKSGGSPVRKSKRSPSGSPDLSFPTMNQFTPDQRRHTSSVREDLLGDGSPLPRKGRSTTMYGFSDNVTNSPPVLSSSYAPDDGNSFVTPAPQRKRPILAPPSTAQRPSQHMPTSSPAPFWRLADVAGTPLRPFDMSPLKQDGLVPPMSSSPPRLDAIGSPSRGAVKLEVEQDLDDEPAFDLSK